MATFCENFKVESALFKDCASTSHVIVGNFTQAVEEQVCFVRGLECIELYSRGLTFIADYKMPNLKIQDISKFTLNGHDVLVIHESVLKFLVIAYIDFEFRTLCLFNFEHMDELKLSGKKFPLNGMLRGFEDWGFVFISDDTLFCSVQTQTNLPTKKLNLSATSLAMEEDIADEDYLYARMGNAFPGVISDFFKPLQQNQLRSHGIVSITDIQLVKQDSVTNILLVLHQGDLDKLVGTKARHPVSRISILELGKIKQQITLLLTIDNLSQYCKQIQPALFNSDYCFVTTPFSIYLIRMEKNWVSEIQLSSVARAIQENFSKDANKQLLLGPSQTQRSVFDQCSHNLKLDGSRMASLPENKLIVALQNGEFRVIQFKFDQANIDLAEVIITKVEQFEKRQASSLAISENLIFMTSYFQDTCCFSLSQSQNTDQVFAGQELEKRQRLNSNTELTRVKHQSSQKYNITLVDSLFCISPITDLVQMPSDGQSAFSKDFLLSSGNQTESYITYAARQMPLNTTNSGKQGLEVFRCGNYILVNQEDSTTKILDLDLNPIEQNYITDQHTFQTLQNLQMMKCGTKISDGTKITTFYCQVKYLCSLNDKYFGISNGKVCQVLADKLLPTEIQASYISVLRNQLISTDGDKIQIFNSQNLSNCQIQFNECSSQPPYLRRGAHQTRSITDPSYELTIADTTEITTKIIWVSMVELKNVVCLICHRSDGRILCYQQCSVETYRLLTPSLLATLNTETLKLVTIEDSAILFSDTMIPIIIVQRHGIVNFVQFSNEIYKSLVYINSLQFVAVNKQNEILTVKILKGHDPNLHSVQFSDGYVMKRHVFESKGIKQMTKFRPMGMQGEQEYLFIATFVVQAPQATKNFEMGFVAETKAPDTIYTLLVFKCPKNAQEISLFQNEPIATEKFNDNQMITGLSEVILQNQDLVFKTFMTVTSLTIDTTKRKDDEKGFYSSSLRIYQIHQNKLKTCLVESYKRSVTVVSSFMGQLVCSKIFNTLPDFLLVFQSFNEQKSKFDDEKSFPIPDGSVKNLANCISFDQDFIFIGDTLTNIQILKKNNAHENEIDHVDPKKLHFKKYLSNNINANVVGCYSMSRYLNYDRTDLVRRTVDAEGTPLGQCKEMSEAAKRMLCILGFSTDGYIRMYGVREEKTLQIVAQLNIQDKILATKPLFVLNNTKEELHERKIAVITQRSGVQIVTPCSEKTHRAWLSIQDEMSNILPFKGALTPTHSHLEPMTPQPEVTSFNQRLNGCAINLSQSLDQFYFLQQNIQQHLQSKAGLENLNQLK